MLSAAGSGADWPMSHSRQAEQSGAPPKHSVLQVHHWRGGACVWMEAVVHASVKNRSSPYHICRGNLVGAKAQQRHSGAPWQQNAGRRPICNCCRDCLQTCSLVSAAALVAGSLLHAGGSYRFGCLCGPPWCRAIPDASVGLLQGRLHASAEECLAVKNHQMSPVRAMQV